MAGRAMWRWWGMWGGSRMLVRCTGLCWRRLVRLVLRGRLGRRGCRGLRALQGLLVRRDRLGLQVRLELLGLLGR